VGKVVKTNKQMIMKSEKKLQQAIRQLDWMKQALECGASIGVFTIDEIKRQLHEFMVDNEPTPKKGEFNIWDWTLDDKLRPVLGGVLHDSDEKVAVATNLHLLVVDSECYDEHKADSVGYQSLCSRQSFKRPIDEYGNFIDGRFPNWEAVIPPKDGYVKFKVDQKQLNDYIEKCNAYIKMNGLSKSKTYGIYEIKISDEQSVFFEMNNLRLFLTATDGYIYVKECDRAAMYWSDTRTALIMPMLRPCKNDVLQSAKELGLIITERP
jgi:hypothetical protein